MKQSQINGRRMASEETKRERLFGQVLSGMLANQYNVTDDPETEAQIIATAIRITDQGLEALENE